MAKGLNRILNDSNRAAEIYGSIIEAGDMDSKLWELAEIRKNHQQIAGDLKRRMAQVEEVPSDRGSPIWPEVRKHPARRVYEDEALLTALLEGERAELEDCRKALNGGDDDTRLVNSFVANQIMPVLDNHIETLSRYLRRAKKRVH